MKKYLIAFLLLALPAQAVEVKEVLSPGGIKAWLVEEHALPLVAVQVSFTGSGYAYDPAGGEGRANLLTAMLTEGAGDLSSREFSRALEERAIRLNAALDEDNIYLSAEFLSEQKDAAFSYLGLAAAKPRFDAEAFERTRRQALALIVQQEQSPGYLATRAWRKMAFGTHPYARQQTGTKEGIDASSADGLRDAHAKYFSRENLLISVVGDITPEALSKLLDANFSNLNAHYAPDASVPEIQISGEGAQETVDFDIPQTVIAFGLQGLKRDDPDYYAAYVMNQILGGGGSLTSKLGIELREKRGLTYGVGTALEPMKYGAAWRGQMATRNEKAVEALAVLRATLNDFAVRGPSEKEMTDAKQFLTGSFVLSLDSNGEIAKFLTGMQINALGRDYLAKRNDYIAAVTRQEVARVAKRMIEARGLLVALAGKPILGQ